MKKLLILLSTVLLASCSYKKLGVVALENDEVTCSFTFNNYDKVRIHTDLQNTYLDDDYRNIGKYASGTSELSRPVTFTLDWDFTISSSETVNNYYLNVTTNYDDISSFKTYICPNSEYTFTNLMIGTTYYYFVTANLDSASYSSDIHTFTTEAKGPRNVYISGITNARDMGGYTNINGKRIRQGLIYRTGQLNERYTTTITPKLTEAGRKMLIDNFGIRSEIDLRETTNNECGAIYASILGKNVNYFPYHMSWDVTNAAKNETEMIRNVFKVFTNRNNYPVVFHCAIGTDRTGVIAFYLGALLGLNDVDLYRDYLFSNFGNIDSGRGLDNINSHFAYLNTFAGNNIQEKAYSYFQSIGFTVSELDMICNIMIID